MKLTMDTRDDESIIIHKINPKEARVEVVTQFEPEGDGPVLAPHAAHKVRLGRRADATLAGDLEGGDADGA